MHRETQRDEMAHKSTEQGMAAAEPTDRVDRIDHGGDPGRAAHLYDGGFGPWLDLSTGINPQPYPFEPPPDVLWQALPDKALMDGLIAAAAAFYGADGPQCLVAAPGSQALIQLLPRLVEPGRTAILGPTYGEFDPAFSAAGHRVDHIENIADAAGYDIAVIVNPNNPDGRRIAPERLADLAATLNGKGGLLVIDEAFCDPEPAISTVPFVARSSCVVLRSFGKFFGLAGIRLGFAVTQPAFAARMRAALGPWPVSGPAAWIGEKALSDRQWVAETRMRLRQQAMQLDGLLEGAGFKVIGGTALFRLAATPDGETVFEALAGHGVYVRHFDAHPGILRFGLPDFEADWQRLARALDARH